MNSKRYVTARAAGLLCGVVFCAGAVRAADQPVDNHAVPRFALCPAIVSEVALGTTTMDGKDYTEIDLVLNEAGKEQFAAFTELHLGDVVAVVFDAAVLSRGTVQAYNTGGHMRLTNWTSIDAATRISQLLMDESLDAPCGPL